MTPDQLSAYLRGVREHLQAAPQALESAAQLQLHGLPPTVSMQVTRTGSGVHVVLSGRGARAAARSLGPRLTRAARGIVRP